MSNTRTGSGPPSYTSVNLRMQEIQTDGVHSSVSYSDQKSHLNFPVILMTFLRWIGIVQNSFQRCLYLICMFTFNIFLAYTLIVNFGVFAYSFLQYDKIHFYWLKFLSFAFITGTYYTLLYKRKNVSDVLTQLNKIARYEKTMLVNILTCLFCSVNFLFVLASIIIYFRETNIYLSAPVHVLVVSGILSTFIYQTFLNLFVLMYFWLCRRCCSSMDRLIQEICQKTPTAFEYSEQIGILNQKASIDDILGNMEEIFSGPSVLLITGSFLSGISSIQVFLSTEINFAVFNLIYLGLNSFVSMFVVLWVAISLTSKLRSLKKEFIVKARMRLLCTANFTDPQIDIQLFEKPNFIFFGWKLITFQTNIFFILILIIVTLCYFLM